MHTRLMGQLLTANMIPLTVGMGLFPILPLYAAQFGATPASVGLLYSATYAASVAGIALTGWLGERVPRRALFVAGGSVGSLALLLLAVATALWQVMLSTAAIWFSGAVTITLINVFTGQLTDGKHRGASFALLFMAYPLGAVLGGSAVGRLATGYGYAPMFWVLAAGWTALPLFGLWGLRGLHGGEPQQRSEQHTNTAPLGTAFGRVLLAAFLSALAINVSRLGTSLSMQALGFSVGAVASTAVVSGLVAAPISLGIGLLSDRLGHRRIVIASYTLAAGGALLLVIATQLWQFSVAATLLFVAWCVNAAVTSALAADTLAPDALGRGIPRLNMMDSLASIVGFAGAGYGMELLGASGVYGLAVGLAVLAVPVIATTRRPTVLLCATRVAHDRQAARSTAPIEHANAAAETR